MAISLFLNHNEQNILAIFGKLARRLRYSEKSWQIIFFPNYIHETDAIQVTELQWFLKVSSLEVHLSWCITVSGEIFLENLKIIFLRKFCNFLQVIITCTMYIFINNSP